MPPRHRLTVDAPRRPADAALLAALRAPEAAASLLDQLYGTYPGMEPWQLTIAADVAVTGPGGRAAGVLDLDIAGERDFACRLCGEVFDVPEREYDIAKDVCRDHYALRVLEARWDAFDVGLPDPTDWGYEPAVRQPDEPRPEKAAAAARYCACIACRDRPAREAARSARSPGRAPTDGCATDYHLGGAALAGRPGRGGGRAVRRRHCPASTDVHRAAACGGREQRLWCQPLRERLCCEWRGAAWKPRQRIIWRGLCGTAGY